MDLRKMKFRGLAAVAALTLMGSFGSARAQNILELDCTPLPTGRIEKDPIVAIHVRVERPDWRVLHTAASGARYERSNQYWLHDATSPQNLSWLGTLVGKPYLKMIGTVFLQNNTFFYAEELHDARKNDAVVAASRASCVPAAVAPPQPGVTASAAPPQPASPAPSQELTIETVPDFSSTADGPFSILVVPNGRRPDIIVSGVIPLDADARFRAAITDHGISKHGAVVILNSTGGSLMGGLALGRAIREMRLDTGLETIHDTAKCFSACAYAFLGGVSRAIGPGYIGFHQFSISADNAIAGSAAVRTSQELMVAIDGYLKEMSASRELLSVATNAEPSKIRMLSTDEATRFRVNYDDESSMKQWRLEALPTGLAMKTESETGSRETTIACAFGNNIQLELRWNRNDYQKLPTKSEVIDIGPKFTVNGVDSGDYTESIEDSASSLVVRFVIPIKDARALIVRSYPSGDALFYAGMYHDGRSPDVDLMMHLPVEDLPPDLDALLASCH
ncbi:MAG TPA: hypothetical protein VGH40_16595 [Roseiarcus sp.]